MKSWIPKKQILNLFFVGMLISFLVYCGVLTVVFLEIRKIENIFNSSESKSARYERAKSIKSVANLNSEVIESLRSFFVNKEDEVGFIKGIEDLAKESGIKFSIEAINQKAEKEESEKIDIVGNMLVEGKWENILVFLNKVEKMKIGSSVESFSADYKDKEVWEGKLDFIVYREK